jgi:hypothetical protein
MKKTALDEAAKAYWKLLYGEYGEQLVRDVPRRIKAALFAKSKIASIVEDSIVLPVAHHASTDNMVVEGMYVDNSQKLMFRATLDTVGEVSDLRFFDLR